MRPIHVADGPQDQQLFQTLRTALRSGEPLEFLAVVSGFLEVTDPRSRDPFAPERQRAGLDDLVESFVGTPYAETTAALTAIKALVADEVLGARIGRELGARRPPLPDWLTGLGQARPEREVWFMTHVLGDGDDHVIGMTLPSGHALSAQVYVDHNLGTVVKDALVVPESLEDLAIKMGTPIDDPDQTLTRTDPAAARAVEKAAIDDGSRLYPPLISDSSWPMCRPLVEWMVRMLPTGGVGPELKEWSQDEITVLSAEFFASSFGAPLDQDDERDLLDSVLWFGTSYATGDPWRWSPVTVEMLLADWFPRKVIAEASYLATLPNLLRAWIRYCHDRNDIRADLTAETLAAVDKHEPEYLRLIRGDRQMAMAGLAEAVLESERVKHLSDEEFDWTGQPRREPPDCPGDPGRVRCLRRRGPGRRAPYGDPPLPGPRRAERPEAVPAQGLTGQGSGSRGVGDCYREPHHRLLPITHDRQGSGRAFRRHWVGLRLSAIPHPRRGAAPYAPG